MKHRNPCISSRSQGGATSGISGHSALSKSVSSCSTSPTATRSLSDLLLAIQDELGQMSLWVLIPGVVSESDFSGSPVKLQVCYSRTQPVLSVGLLVDRMAWAGLTGRIFLIQKILSILVFNWSCEQATCSSAGFFCFRILYLTELLLK